MKHQYFYKIDIKRVKDGDTIVATFDLGFRAKLDVVVRLKGVDSPEIWRPLHEKEKIAGLKVTEYLKSILSANTGRLYCLSNKIDVYGRSVGELYYEDDKKNMVNINEMVTSYMIAENLTQVEARS
jgi:endonuclease YncB( thermonuclease family)